MKNTTIDLITTQDIIRLVQDAAKTISPVWPIETFIACNPLQGYEDMPFQQAITTHFANNIPETNHPFIDQINREMIKWSGAFLDLGQGSIEMPQRDLGFYQNFCRLALYDQVLHQNHAKEKNWLRELPADPAAAIAHCMEKLGIPFEDYQAFITQTLGFLPGWAGYVKWLSEWNLNESLKNKLPIDLLQYVAVRLVITCLLWPQATLIKKKLKDRIAIQQILTNMDRLEQVYQRELSKKIAPVFTTPPDKKSAQVQMVFCIDVRSEPFRRQLEALGAYETLGFAGFFGLAVRVHEINQSKSKDCCPVLLQPRFEVKTKLLANAEEYQSYQKGQDFLQSFQGAYQQLKYNFTTPFNLADAMGPWCGIGMLMKNFLPKTWTKLLQFGKQKIQPKYDTEVLIDEQHHLGIPHQEQVEHAKIILELMGLQQFAKLVVFCGHKAATTNNPYASGLDCGACGGNHGEYNAKLLAKILNRPEVRADLGKLGLHIPADTVFLAAIHNTTTDDCELFDSPTSMHADLLQQFRSDLKLAQMANLTHRQQDCLDQTRSFLDRSLHWAETRPEWGLARNAGFLVAPRSLSQNIDLEGRCFLHSYDWQIDEDGKLLTTILTAPMVVAQWINTQYLFSTLDNVHYGSGSKITHNVVGKLGIMQGNGSDLMHGLPLQSVRSTDDENFHQPQRLLCMVYAPKAKVMSIIQEQAVLTKLFDNVWVKLMVIDPIDKQFYQYSSKHTWELYQHDLP